MSESVGIGFLIGATLASSFTGTLSTASAKVKDFSSKIRQEEKTQRLLNKAISAEEELQSKKAELLADRTNKKLLADYKKVSASYLKAKQDALAYGRSVDEWRKAVDKGSKSLEVNYQIQNRLRTLEKERSVRSGLVSDAIGVAATGYMLSRPIADAIKFEAAMADVTKTIDGTRDSSGKLTSKYYEVETAIKQMGREVPLTHEQISSLFAIGGQQGMGTAKELEEFALLSAQMGVAFGMSSESAAEAIGGYRTALGLNMNDTRSMLDLMNHFANTTSASEAGIAQIVQRVGALGGVAGVDPKPLTALAATLDAMKVSPEMAATGIKNLMLGLVAGEAATKSQQEAFARLGLSANQLAKDMQNDGEGTIINVLERVKNLNPSDQASVLQQIFGKESLNSIAPLLSQLDLLRENFKQAGDEALYTGATQEEYNNRSQTTSAQLTKLSNSFKEVSLTVGSAVLPAVNGLVQAVMPAIGAFASFADENEGLIQVGVGVVAGLVAIKAATIAYGFAASGVRTAVAAFAVIQKTATAGQWLFNAAMAANPIGMAVIAISALIGGMVYLYNTCEPVRKAFNTVFSIIGNGLSWVWDKLTPVLDGIKAVADWFGDDEEDSMQAQSQKKLEENKKKLEVSSGLKLAGAGEEISPMAMPDLSHLNSYAMNTNNTNTSSLSLNMNFALNGVTDTAFAERLMRALESKKSEVEDFISELVSNESRVAYDN